MKSPVGTRFYNFQPPTLTLSNQTLYAKFRNFAFLLCLLHFLDHMAIFVYVPMNMGMFCY